MEKKKTMKTPVNDHTPAAVYSRKLQTTGPVGHFSNSLAPHAGPVTKTGHTWHGLHSPGLPRQLLSSNLDGCISSWLTIENTLSS
jgi:hypothetical protein